VDSSVVGYDGGRNVRDEERSVGRKRLVRKPEPERKISWPRWTGLRGKTVWDWLQLLVVLIVLSIITVIFTSISRWVSVLPRVELKHWVTEVSI
jgi:hypothetical protein